MFVAFTHKETKKEKNKYLTYHFMNKNIIKSEKYNED